MAWSEKFALPLDYGVNARQQGPYACQNGTFGAESIARRFHIIARTSSCQLPLGFGESTDTVTNEALKLDAYGNSALSRSTGARTCLRPLMTN